MVLGGHGVEPVQGSEDGVDVGHASSCVTPEEVIFFWARGDRVCRPSNSD
jgi:hypothetical protein